MLHILTAFVFFTIGFFVHALLSAGKEDGNHPST